MESFESRRREPLLDANSYQWTTQFKIEEAIPGYIAAEASPDTDPESRGSMRWHLSRERLSYAILLYSGGQPLEAVRSAFKQALDSIEAHLDGEYAVTDDFDLAIQDSYVQSLWLLSLSKLLTHDSAEVERVANLYAADESNDGADELFELLLVKLGRKGFEAQGLLHEDPYQLLLDCICAEPVARPALMSKFLKRWFKGQKNCDWWGLHVNRTKDPVLKTGFFGYWAFEAALVTYLWDIDDSSYRDLPHYPKDLADYARKSALLPADGRAASRVLGGERCPRSGWWLTPAEPGSRRRFEQGAVMPVVGGDYGATIWQWDDKQD